MQPLLAGADLVVPVDEVSSYVKIRKAPDGEAEIVGRLHRSKPRQHIETVPGWHEVELDDGSTGFVSSDWSVLITEAAGDLPIQQPSDVESTSEHVAFTDDAESAEAQAEPAEVTDAEATVSMSQETSVQGESEPVDAAPVPVAEVTPGL
ncbi:MAG: hypothetical protein OEV03_06810, partial [Gammaproteobacteria bacterium]|nr:hypothetical protein [Gammaproteobacteria bacterium]